MSDLQDEKILGDYKKRIEKLKSRRKERETFSLESDNIAHSLRDYYYNIVRAWIVAFIVIFAVFYLLDKMEIIKNSDALTETLMMNFTTYDEALEQCRNNKKHLPENIEEFFDNDAKRDPQ